MAELSGFKSNYFGCILVLFILLVMVNAVFSKGGQSLQNLQNNASNGPIQTTATRGFDIVNYTKYRFRLQSVSGNVGIPTKPGSSSPYLDMEAYNGANKNEATNHYELIISGNNPQGFVVYNIFENDQRLGDFNTTMNSVKFVYPQSAVWLTFKIVNNTRLELLNP